MIYGEMSLAADTIKVDWRKNILYALPQKNGFRINKYSHDATKR